jgi:hypothetical protein
MLSAFHIFNCPINLLFAEVLGLLGSGGVDTCVRPSHQNCDFFVVVDLDRSPFLYMISYP